MLLLHHDHQPAPIAAKSQDDRLPARPSAVGRALPGYGWQAIRPPRLRSDFTEANRKVPKANLVSTAGIAPATSTFAEWRSYLTELRGQNVVAHRSQEHERPRVIARLQRGANLLQLLGEEWRKAAVMLRPRPAPILLSRQVQPAYICLPSRNGQGGRSCTCNLLVPNKAVCC